MFKKYVTKTTIILALVLFALIVATVSAGYIHSRAEDIGGTAGKTGGTLVGKASGSLRGYFEGKEEGEKRGIEEGRLAKDTTVDIKRTVTDIGNLEVLTAGVTLKNFHEVGESYAGLYVMNGTVVFSVNLSKADVTVDETSKNIHIYITEPEMALFLNQNSLRTLAEIQKPGVKATAEDGFIGYINSMTRTVEKTKEAIANYDSLFSDAKESALTQVQQLAEAVCSNGYVVYVEYK